PDLVTSGLDTVAVRMPRHPVALAVIRATGAPLAAPSANPFGRISPTSAAGLGAEPEGRGGAGPHRGPCTGGGGSTAGAAGARGGAAPPPPGRRRAGGDRARRRRAARARRDLAGVAGDAPHALRAAQAAPPPRPSRRGARARPRCRRRAHPRAPRVLRRVGG